MASTYSSHPYFLRSRNRLQFKALKGFFSRAESNGWIEDKYDSYRSRRTVVGTRWQIMLGFQ